MALKHVTDLVTARRIAANDAEVIESFVRLHYAPLCRFMRHLTKHREDAEDLTQQAFIKAKQHIASYRGNATLRTWLYRIALHEYTHWRRKRRWTQSLETVAPRREPAYDAVVESEALLAALSKLPESHKTAFLLHEVHELSIEETASILGLPQGTVKSRLFHAKRRLITLLNGRQENEIEAKPIYES